MRIVSLTEQKFFEIITEATRNALGQIVRDGRFDSRGFEMLIGIPGSGKSTYLRSLNNHNIMVVCPDDIRVELTGDISDQSRNKDVWVFAEKMILDGLENGRYVILDATNVGTGNRTRLLNRVKSFAGNGLKTYATVFECDPDVSKYRIEKDILNGVPRSNVPPEVVDRMYQQYLETLETIRGEGFDEVFFV